MTRNPLFLSVPRWIDRTKRWLVMILLIHSATVSNAGAWPQWRGPTQDGIAQHEELAEAWPESGPPVLWARELGQGYSAFVVADGLAYTQTQSLYEQSLICLDANTGHERWSYRYGWAYDGGGLYPGPRATPAVADGQVYFAAPNGLIGCVNAATGASVWSVNLKENLRGRGTDFGVSASPVVWRDKVIVPVGGPAASLVALNAKTGQIVWKCGQLPASYATPIVVPFQKHWLVIAPLENSLLCADAETGQQLWEIDLSSGYDEHSAAPVYREPYLMLAGPFSSGAKCYRLVADDDPPGCKVEPVWDSLKLSNDIASSVLIGECVYGFDLKDPQSRLHRPSRGVFRCLNWSDGSVRWSSTEPGHANVIVAGDKLLLFNDRGELRLARVSSNGYEELAATTVFTGEICWTPAALSDGRVFLRTQTRAACLWVGRTPVPSTTPLQTIASIPKVSRFDTTTLVGGEREFPAATPEWSELRLWFLWTVGGLLLVEILSRLFAACSHMILRRWYRLQPNVAADRWSSALSATFFWIGLVISGGLGSVVVNRIQSDFIFTWPLALWGLMQFATDSSMSAAQLSPHRRSAWRARGSILLFVAGCGLYFHLCRRMGLATEWSFLMGFVTACPAAMIAMWFTARWNSWRPWLVVPGHVLGYTLYFWSSVALMKWRMQIGS